MTQLQFMILSSLMDHLGVYIELCVTPREEESPLVCLTKHKIVVLLNPSLCRFYDLVTWLCIIKFRKGSWLHFVSIISFKFSKHYSFRFICLMHVLETKFVFLSFPIPFLPSFCLSICPIHFQFHITISEEFERTETMVENFPGIKSWQFELNKNVQNTFI